MTSTRDLFLKTFRAYFECHSFLYIFATPRFWASQTLQLQSPWFSLRKKTWWMISFSQQADYSLSTKFSGPKIPQGFRETGPSPKRRKTMIWLVWRNIFVLHVRHALWYNSLTLRPWQTSTHCCGHIVADTNVSPFARARNICCGHKFCVRNTKNVTDFVQKHFVSATNVSQFAQHGNTTFILCHARLRTQETSWATMCQQQCLLNSQDSYWLNLAIILLHQQLVIITTMNPNLLNLNLNL